jgi:predicted peptidase
LRRLNPGIVLACLVLLTAAVTPGRGDENTELKPGVVSTLDFPELPPTLFAMRMATNVAAGLQIRLPDNYTRDRQFPLFVYIHGSHGAASGYFNWTTNVVGASDWVIVTLPLFKKTLDAKEPYQGLKVSFDDYAVIRDSYRVMLERVRKWVPNLDPARSGVCGFSNGGHSLAILLTNQDPLIPEYFKSVVFVEGGQSLADLHKPYFKSLRFLMVMGARNADPSKPDSGSSRSLRQSELLEQTAVENKVEFMRIVMEGVGHHFGEAYQPIVGKWLTGQTYLVLPVNLNEKE